MDGIDNLSIELSASAAGAVSNISRLQAALGKTGGSAKSAASGMKTMESDTRKAGESAQRTAESFNEIGNAANKIKNATSAFAGFREKLAKSSISVSDFGKAMTRIPFGAIKGALIDLPKHFGGKLVSSVVDATKQMGQFFGSIKRIALYRAIRSALKAITQGFNEGMKNLYNWSNAVGDRFAASMDRIASSTTYMKNSMAAMAAPLVNAIVPAIDFIIDKFVALMNIINQLFALLGGQATYTAAKRAATSWGGAGKAAGGAAKELKKTVLAFDEINKLNDNSSGGGGGGGGSGGGFGNAFETRQISSMLTEMFNNSDFTALGKMLAQKINNGLASIDWNSVKKKASNIVSSITTFINGFIRQIDPKIFGRSLAEAINTGATMIDQFWSTIDWLTAGIRLRAAILSFFRKIDVETLASALTGKFASLVTLISNALPSDPKEWRVITSKITGLINSCILKISQVEIGTLIGKVIYGSMKMITSLAEAGTLTNIATAIKKAIEDALGEISKEDVEAMVKAVLKDVLEAVKVLFSIQIDFGGVTINPLALMMFTGVTAALIKNAVKNVFGSATMSGLGKSIAFSAGIALAITAAVSLVDVIKDIKENGLTEENFWKLFDSVFLEAIPSLVLIGKGLYGTKIGLKLGLGSVAMDTAGGGGLSGLAGLVGFKASFISMLQKFFSTALGGIFGSFAIVAGVPTLILRLNAKFQFIPDEIDAEYSKRTYTPDKSDPASIYNDPLMGGGTTQPAYMSGFDGDPYMIADTAATVANTKAITEQTKYLKNPTSVRNPSINFNQGWHGVQPNYDFREMFGDDNPVVNALVNFIPQGTGGSRFLNNPLGALIQMFKPGTDTQTRVELVKKIAGQTPATLFNTGSVLSVFAKLLKKDGSKTPATLFGTMLTLFALLTGAASGSKTPATIYGTIASFFAKLTGKDKNSKTAPDIYGTFTNFVSILTGRKPGSNTIQSLYGTNLVVTAELKKKKNNTITWTAYNDNKNNVMLKAAGGVYSNGIWSSIPQYASGTLNAHGSLFLAGENGPEIVGHVGGRTEILNKSQLASVMYNAVHNAMSGVTLDANFYNADGEMNGAGMAELMEYFRADGEAMRQQNELLRQQNELLREINDKDLTVDISTADINRAQTRMNRRAGTTIVPIGT